MAGWGETRTGIENLMARSQRISLADDALQNWYLQILNGNTGYGLVSVHTFRARGKAILGESIRDKVLSF